ncbi:hypothetical protein [Paraburkholderia aromaticivorans]|uniref:hypothetical protein n=1 Tax=Paraburkholderia aromaticivorans TaxID=2026199 RepID=UPI0038BA8DB2
MQSNKKMALRLGAIAAVVSLSVSSAFAVVSEPAPNPFFSSKTYALTHVDPAATDVAPYPLTRGTFHIDPAKEPRVIRGPVNIMTLESTSKDFMWGVSSEGATYIDVSNSGFREVARITPPGVKVIEPAVLGKVLDQHFANVDQVKDAVFNRLGLDQTRVGNGIYGLVDEDNRVYYNTADGRIFVYGLKDPRNPAAGIEVVASRDLSKDVLTGQHGFSGKEGIMGLNLTYDGKLVVLGNNSVSVINRDLSGQAHTIHLDENEFVSNSVAVDDRNGLYFASDKKMHKVVWTGTKLSNDASDGAWSSPYDTGDWMPTVKFGTGTGSTPTLMGFGKDDDRLVVITDGADRMKLVAFWRDQIPEGFKKQSGTKSNRIAGQILVTAGLPSSTKYIQSEQSVVVNGYSAFVVNNIAEHGEKDKLVDVLSLGPINKPAHGAERIDWDPVKHQWKSAWTNASVVSISMAPTMSGPSGIVMTNGYYEKDGWEMDGLDWNTGKVVYRAIFGKSNWGNGGYAQPQLFPNGDLLFNSIGGPIRIRNQ